MSEWDRYLAAKTAQERNPGDKDSGLQLSDLIVGRTAAPQTEWDKYQQAKSQQESDFYDLNIPTLLPGGMQIPASVSRYAVPFAGGAARGLTFGLYEPELPPGSSRTAEVVGELAGMVLPVGQVETALRPVVRPGIELGGKLLTSVLGKEAVKRLPAKILGRALERGATGLATGAGYESITQGVQAAKGNGFDVDSIGETAGVWGALDAVFGAGSASVKAIREAIRNRRYAVAEQLYREATRGQEAKISPEVETYFASIQTATPARLEYTPKPLGEGQVVAGEGFTVRDLKPTEKPIVSRFKPQRAPGRGNAQRQEVAQARQEVSPKAPEEVVVAKETLPAKNLDTMSEAIALSSPSGRMSKRAKAAADERLRKELFGPTGHLEGPRAIQPDEKTTLLRQASELRDLAARGMKPRAHLKRAEELERQAKALAGPEEVVGPKSSTVLRSMTGGVLGFQRDDEGNITFDPKLALAGMAASVAVAGVVTRGQKIRELRRLVREGTITEQAAKKMESAVLKGKTVHIENPATSAEKITIEGQPVAERPQPKPFTGEGRVAGINLNNFSMEGRARQQVERQVETIRPELENIKGKPLSHDEVVEAANTATVLRDTFSREDAKRIEAEMLRTKQAIASLGEKVAKAGGRISETEAKHFVNLINRASTEATYFGRGLEAHKIGVEGQDPLMVDVMRKVVRQVEEAKGSLDEVAAAASKVNWKDAREVTDFYRKYFPATKSEWIDEFRYINLLSSPRTHIVNITSNVLQVAGLRPATRLMAGGLDNVAAMLPNYQRQYYLRQVPAYYRGMANSVGQAVKAAGDAFMGRSIIARPDIARLGTGSPLLSKTGMIYVPRAMEAADVFFRTLAESGEYEALAYGLKRARKALDPTALHKEAERVATETVFRGPIDPTNATRQGYLLSGIDKMTQLAYHFRRVPGGKWFVPFVQTPMNIIKQGLEYSPAGLGTAVGSGRKMEQTAKALVGSMVFAGAGAMALEGRTTWATPRSKRERDMFFAAGLQPYSVKIGDTWVSYSKLGPLAYPIAMAAALRYYTAERREALTDEQTESVQKALLAMAQFFADQSYMEGIQSLISAGKGEDAAILRALTSAGQQLIPLSSLQRWVAQIIDPIYRNPKKGISGEALVDQLRKDMPFLSKDVEPYRTPTGEPSERVMPVRNAFSPFALRPENPAVAKVYREQQERSRQQTLKASERQQIVDRLTQTGSREDILTAYRSGAIDKTQTRRLLDRTRQTELVRRLVASDMLQAVDLYRIAAPEQQAALRPFLLEKLQNARRQKSRGYMENRPLLDSLSRSLVGAAGG